MAAACVFERRRGGAGAVAPSRITGVVAAVVTATIWAGWIVATRHAVTETFSPVDVGLLRFGLPTLLLAPAWLRVGLLPRGVPLRVLAVIVAGSGAPFFLTVATGMREAPAADVGALLPGTMPFWAALIGWATFGERFGPWRRLGYLLVGTGVLTVAWQDLASDGLAWRGHLLLLAAAIMWAAYTHAFRRSGLTAVQAAGIVATWSLLAHLGLAAVFGTGLAHAEPGDLAVQALAQGLLSGCAAILAYGMAVRRLGPTSAAAFSALTPVLAALGGVALLGETPSLLGGVAVLTTALGVLLATSLVERRA